MTLIVKPEFLSDATHGGLASKKQKAAADDQPTL